MKLLAILGGLAALLPAAAFAQPVYVAPAGSNQTGTPGVTARAVTATAPPVPESGTATYRIQTGDGKCLVPQVNDGRIYLIRTGGCIDALIFNARFYGEQRARLELDGSGVCAAFRHVEMHGSGLTIRSWGQGLGTTACGEALEQRFRIDWAEGGTVSIRNVGGQCWFAAPTAIIETACDRRAETRFRLVPVVPAGYIAPAPGTGLAVATPVRQPDPAPPPPDPAAPVRPEENGPLEPGRYYVRTQFSGFCPTERYIATGAAPRRLWLSSCNLSEHDFEIRPLDGGLEIELAYTSRKCATEPAGGPPAMIAAPCGSPRQRFTFEPYGAGNHYYIRTPAGLCWTIRGAASREPEANNSAIFAEPCRGAPEQLFEFEWRGEPRPR